MTVDQTLQPVQRSRGAVCGASLFFWIIAAFLLFWAVGVRELWTAENRWAEITRNMVQSGDYFHPRINGEPYFDKPLGGYWTIAVASKLTGGVNEWAIRLPSALAGLVALGATISLGRRLWSADAGHIAGWILLSSYGFLFWARTGQADMENLAFTMLAIAWYWKRRDQPGFITSVVFYAICFVGAQMKGLGAVAVPCLAVLPDLLRDKRWKHFLTLSHLAALLLGALIYFTPFIIESRTRGAYGESGLNLVFRENVQRFFDPFDHKEPFYVYLYYLPILFLPWAPLLITALITAVKFRREFRAVDYPTRWLLEAFALVFLFFTASGSRRGYYIIPLLPFCALLCARFVLSPGLEKERRTAIDLQKIIALVLSIGGLIACATWPFVKGRIPIPISGSFVLSLAGISLIGLIPLGLRTFRPRLLESLAGISANLAVPLVATALLVGGYLCVSHVSLDSLRTTRRFATELRSRLPQPEQLAFYQSPPTALATIVFYLNDSELHAVLQNPADVVRFLNDRPGLNRVCITRESYQSLSSSFPPNFFPEVFAAEQSPAWETRGAKAKKWIVIQSPSG
jgi:hypothetical protein